MLQGGLGSVMRIGEGGRVGGWGGRLSNESIRQATVYESGTMLFQRHKGSHDTKQIMGPLFFIISWTDHTGGRQAKYM